MCNKDTESSMSPAVPSEWASWLASPSRRTARRPPVQSRLGPLSRLRRASGRVNGSGATGGGPGGGGDLGRGCGQQAVALVAQGGPVVAGQRRHVGAGGPTPRVNGSHHAPKVA